MCATFLTDVDVLKYYIRKNTNREFQQVFHQD